MAAERARRFQFSLALLLALAITAGTVMGIYFTRRRIDRLRSENRAIREELGELNIDDPKQAYQMELRTDTAGRRWKIYLPEDRLYRVCIHARDIPIVGLPDSPPALERTVELKAGVHEFQFRHGRYDATNGHRTYVALTESAGLNAALSPLPAELEYWGRTAGASPTRPWLGLGEALAADHKRSDLGKTDELARDGPIVFLLLMDKAPRNGKPATSTRPGPGLMVWMTPLRVHSQNP